MKRTFWAVLLLALAVRLGAAWLAPHPGIADANHYFNVAKNVAAGRGLLVDYIWHYHNPPPDITHVEDYWMPLPALYPALTLALFGESVFAALLPNVLFGVLAVALAWELARAAGLGEAARLWAMLGVLLLPELMVNSARVDTAISYVVYVGAACLAFYYGYVRGGAWWAAAGAAAGLAHLTRQDAVLLAPAFVVATGVLWAMGWRARRAWLLLPLAWLLVLLPYFWHNWQHFGVLLNSGAGRTLFMTSFIDQFTYGRTLDLDHYLAWGLPNILANMATMAAANVRTMTSTLDVFLPVLAIVGAGALLLRRDRTRGALFVLPLVMLLGLFCFYSFVTPFHTQGGSFKKSYLFTLPFWAVLAAQALETFVRPRRAVWVAVGVGVLLVAMNSVYALRAEFDATRRFDASVRALAPVLRAYGDVNGDGEIVIMTQDPFILSYHGFRALMLPSDPLDMILAAAYRYGVDYILLPAARPALDGFWYGGEQDDRLVWLPATDVYQLLRVLPPR